MAARSSSNACKPRLLGRRCPMASQHRKPTLSDTIPREGYVRMPLILHFLPISRTAWLNGVRDGRYPKPRKVGRCNLWRAQDIHAVIAAKENPRGLLIFRDELIGFLAALDREDRKSDRGFYLEAWNGYGSYLYDRIGRGTVPVENCCVSILGGIQPAKLLAYLHQTMDPMGDDGLLQRFQLLVYPDEPREWDLVDCYPDKEAKERALDILKNL